MTFEDELRREREEVSRTTRREAVLITIRREKRKDPNINEEELIEELSLDYKVSEDIVRECLQEYYRSLEE